MGIPRRVGLGVALVVSLSLVGCFGEPTAVKSTPSEAEPVAPAEPANPGVVTLDAEKSLLESLQVRETGLIAPPQVYEGECVNLYSEAEMSEVVGLPVTLVADSQVPDFRRAAIELHGGIQCFWQSSDRSAAVELLAIPEKAVHFQNTYDCFELSEPDAFGCDVAFVGGWLMVSGIASETGRDLSALETQQDALMELFGETILAKNLALPPIPAAGAWAFPADCASIVDAAQLDSVPGLGAGSTGQQFWDADAYYPNAEVALWHGTGPGECLISGDSAEVYFTALGGARYNEASISAAPGAKPLAVAGVDSAFVTPTDDGRYRIDVFDGPNWLWFEVRFTKNAAPIAIALVAALDATGAP